MNSRITATLAICALAGGATALGLARPATTTPAVVAPAADHSAMAGHDGAAAPATGADITIQGFAFAVAGTFTPGQTITIVNADSAEHTVTADDGSFSSGSIPGGATVQMTLPTAPGTYSFFCAVHPSMTASFTIAG